eukprot:scaffold104717_cov20-Prasinocladus_malaysianus.AAC.1
MECTAMQCNALHYCIAMQCNANANATWIVNANDAYVPLLYIEATDLHYLRCNLAIDCFVIGPGFAVLLLAAFFPLSRYSGVRTVPYALAIITSRRYYRSGLGTGDGNGYPGNGNEYGYYSLPMLSGSSRGGGQGGKHAACA